jgi:hypothetical protein
MIDVVDDVYCYWKVDSEHMINKLMENNDISNLKDWVGILQRNLSRFKQKYQEYNELTKYLNVEQILTKIIGKCEKSEDEACDEQKKAQTVGGTLAGTGVPASIVDGVFTFGIGTVVGLAVTGAVAGTAAVGGAVATGITVKVADDYGRVIGAFKSLRSEFDTADHLRIKLNGEISSVHAQVVNFSRVLDDVKIESQRNDDRSRQLLNALCLLETRGKELKAKSSAARCSAKAAIDRLQNMTY